MNREEILDEIKRVELIIRKKTAGTSTGRYMSLFKGQGVEVTGVREYSQNDDYRLIDWNSTARAGKLHTRIIQDERDLQIFILADVSASMQKGGSCKTGRKTKKETAAVVAAVIGFSAENSSDRTGCILFSDQIEKEIPPARGRCHVFSIVSDILSSKPAGGSSGLSRVLNAMPPELLKRGTCIVISDFIYPIPWKEVLKVSGRSEIIFFRISDPVEKMQELPYRFYSYDSDTPENKPEKRFGRAGPDVADAENFLLQKKDFGKYRIPFMDISTDDNIVEKVNSFFKYRKR